MTTSKDGARGAKEPADDPVQGRFGSYIPPLLLAESDALLDEFWAHATREEFAWTQKWQVGDLLIWDNRCTMHRRDGFAGHGRRRMHRLMTRGERPA